MHAAAKKLVLFLGLTQWACPSEESKPPDTNPPTGRVAIAFADKPFEKLPVVDGYPTAFSGSVSGTSVALRYDATLKDPVTAKGACLDVLVRCLESLPSGDASVRRCVAEAPVCATQEPWNEAPCCPTACKDAFAAEAGASAYDAAIEHFADGVSCYPGLEAFLGAAR
ncbi:MAG: hypothetical protein HY791_21180 [Deltaproteobacteria bacterium]|nr:hypothetical protein [Deltaproteobacteria bacterium]